MKSHQISKRSNKKAVWSFVLGVLSIGIWLAIIPAIILLVLAAREKQRDPSQKGIRLAWCGVLLGSTAIFFQIAPVLGVDVWSRFEAARVWNELRTVRMIETVRISIAKHKERSGGYPSSLEELVKEGLLSPEVAGGAVHGYRYTYAPRNLVEIPGIGRSYSAFSLVVKPDAFYRGKRAMYLDETGSIIIRESADPNSKVEDVLPPPPEWRGVGGT